MNFFRAALVTLLAVPAILFGTATAAQATGQPYEVNDDRVIGASWTALNARTTAPVDGAHLDFMYGAYMRGNDGCNDFWGHGSVNRETGTITIHVEGMTRMACTTAPAFDVMGLEGSSKYYLYGGRLTISNESGARASFAR